MQSWVNWPQTDDCISGLKVGAYRYQKHQKSCYFPKSPRLAVIFKAVYINHVPVWRESDWLYTSGCHFTNKILNLEENDDESLKFNCLFSRCYSHWYLNLKMGDKIKENLAWFGFTCTLRGKSHCKSIQSYSE